MQCRRDARCAVTRESGCAAPDIRDGSIALTVPSVSLACACDGIAPPNAHRTAIATTAADDAARPTGFALRAGSVATRSDGTTDSFERAHIVLDKRLS